jgi:hypothetical protein
MSTEFFDGLNFYRVSLTETPDDDSPIIFECWAEDQAHAIEQAENAYPECVTHTAIRLD